MTLTLNILRCPDAVPPETRRVQGGEFSIGRGPGNDWILADPDRHLSKRHCVFAFRNGAWQLADTSTNGTFLNREAEPLGPGAPRTLRDGDRLRLGAYEIEIGLSEEPAQGFGWTPSARSPARTASPFDDDPFADAPPPAHRPAASAFGGPGGGPGGGVGENPFADPSSPSVRLPSDFNPLSPDAEEAPFGAASQQDHTPALEDAFQPPRALPSQPGGGLLPENWDLDEPGEPVRPAAPRSPAAGSPGSGSPGLGSPAFGSPAFGSPWDEPQAAPPPPPPIEPVWREPPSAPMAAPPPATAATAAPAVPVARASEPAAAVPSPAGDGGALMAAFLEGAGLGPPAPTDPEAAMRALGAAFRATVSGLREVLIARAAIKGEFRIEQTMIRTRGNNPLKFSANDDDALAALLGTGRRVDMAPEAAINDALRDMRLHELATMSAMQAAVRELLARLDPAALRHAAEGGVALPGQRQARAWAAFEKLHADITRALADDFDSVFGRAFARAYEQALAEAGAHKDPS